MIDAFTPKSDFLRVLIERGYVHQCSDYAGLDEKALSGSLVAYIGFDCTAPSLHVGSLLQIMMLRWLQQTGGKPLALMGGGTTMVGDPSGKDESRKLLTVEQIEANKAGIRKVFDRFIAFGDGKTDAVDARQRRMARLAQLHRLPARRRPPLLGQSHAGDGFGQAAARPRARAVVSRIQLHVPAGLRLRRAAPALRLHAADGRLRPMGQHRHRPRPRPPHGNRAALRPHLAADHHRFRRQDGQDRRRRDVARRRDARAPTTTGSSGATARTPTSAASSSCSPCCRSTRSRGSRRSAGRRSTKRRRRSPTRRPRCCTAARRPRRRRRPRDKTFEEGALAESLPTVEVPAAEFDAGLGVLTAFVRAGLVASTGEARRQIRGGGLRVNDVALADERAIDRPRRASAAAWSSCRSAARSTCCCARCDADSAPDRTRSAHRRWRLQAAHRRRRRAVDHAEHLAQEARRHRRQRIDIERRPARRSDDAVVDAEQAFVSAAAEQRAEHRNVR